MNVQTVLRRSTLLVGVGLVLAGHGGCGGAGPDAADDDGDPVDDAGPPDADLEDPSACAGNAAPEAPSIVAPVDGQRDVFAADLVVSASPYVDVDGDPPLESEWEIWLVAGELSVLRVWSATMAADGAMTEVTLADGAFESGTGLGQDRRYEVRVRHRASAGCAAWSGWSAPSRFEIEDGSAYFFAEDQIRDVYLEITPAVLAALDAQAYPPGCVPYERQSYPATMTFEGVTYDVGVKTKGGCGSARDPVAPFERGKGKASWKINLEWDDPAVEGCPASQRLYGQKSLTLNNEVQDGSFVHEQLAYHFYRLMGVAVPRANNVRLHVNGEPWGLYLNLETVNRRMLGRNFASRDGMLYEGTYWCDLISSSVPATDDYAGANTDHCIGKEFEVDACSTPEPGADPIDYGLIRGLVAGIAALPDGGYYPAIEQLFDFDAFLSMWAVEAIINHWDGFVFDIMNNYRIYHDPGTDRWSVIPSGVDQTFTTSRDRSAFTVANIVARRCLAEEDCEAAFAARLEEALAVFEAADLAARATAIRDRISADVMADPRKEVSHATFLSRVTSTVSFIQNRPATIRQDLAAHGFPQP